MTTINNMWQQMRWCGGRKREQWGFQQCRRGSCSHSKLDEYSNDLLRRRRRRSPPFANGKKHPPVRQLFCRNKSHSSSDSNFNNKHSEHNSSKRSTNIVKRSNPELSPSSVLTRNILIMKITFFSWMLPPLLLMLPLQWEWLSPWSVQPHSWESWFCTWATSWAQWYDQDNGSHSSSIPYNFLRSRRSPPSIQDDVSLDQESMEEGFDISVITIKWNQMRNPLICLPK